MNNKIILTLALSLSLSSFVVAQAEDATPAAEPAAEKTVDTPDAKAVKDMMLEASKEQDAKDAAAQENMTQDIANQDATAQDASTTEATNSDTNSTEASETEETSSTVSSAAPPLGDVEFSGVSSLRGENAINSESQKPDIKQLPEDRPPIQRNYFQQPPLIPHRIREYRITKNHNKCLSCHSWKNAAKMGATKISQTHFADRDGNTHSAVAARRYFCTQCHVPQVNAKPLVENEFKPVDDLK